MAFTNTGALNGSGLFSSDLINNGVIDVSSGVREINGVLSSTKSGGGTITIEATGTLQLDKAVSGNNLMFAGSTGTLTIEQLGSVASSFDIVSINLGDVIKLPNVPPGFVLNYNTSTGTLAISSGGSTIGDLVFTPAASLTANFIKNAVVQCFVSGTKIETEDGPRPVEALKAGDQVVTENGVSGTIEWVGRRDVDCEHHPAPEKVRPFRIAAHAFGQGCPGADLLLSPDHSVFVNDVLIPVKYLENGTTVRQLPVSQVTYHHFELRDHAIVRADGLTVETLLPGSDKTGFVHGSKVTALYPEFTVRSWETAGAARLVVTGPELESVRRDLNLRAPAARAARVRRPKVETGT